MFEIIQAVRPDYVIGENVPGLLSIEGGMVFEQVCLDLEGEGYEVQAFVLPACATGAPHRRDRVWIVGYNTNEIGINRCSQASSNEGEQPTDSEQPGSGRTSETGGYVGERIVTDTNEVRLQQCENRGEMGGGQAEICGTGGKSSNAIEANGKVETTSNAQQIGHGGWSNENGIGTEREIHQDFGHDRNRVRSEIERCDRVTQNTGSSGCQHGINDQQGYIGNFGKSRTGGNEWDINAEADSDTGIQGHQRSEQPGTHGERPGQGESHRPITELYSGNYWHDWPSISPFHSGHDGLPPELVRHIRTTLAEVGETPENIEAYIRKEANWLRKQAIMAAGNAVVPTVVLQIMKAIEYHHANQPQ